MKMVGNNVEVIMNLNLKNLILLKDLLTIKMYKELTKTRN